MAVAFVQGWENNSSSTAVTTITVTVSGATSGNLLVAIVAPRFGTATATTFTTPSGWTLITDCTSTASATGATYFRYADGTSADNFIPVWANTARVAAAVAEYSGLSTSAVLDTSAETESQIQSSTTTVSTGSASPSVAGMAVAFLSASMSAAWTDTDITIDSSFTKRVTAGQNVTARACAAIAELDLTTTSSVSATWTSAVAVIGTYAAIAVFKEPGGAAYDITPTAATVDVTGAALTLNVARSLTTTAATVVVTGGSLALEADRTITPVAATVDVTGGTLTLTYTPAAGAYVIDPLPATVVVTGAPLSLVAARSMSLGGVAAPGLLPFVATSAGAGTRYASPSGSGSSFTIGTPGPVRTAISGAVPGDVVFLRGGVYDISTLRVNISVSGTSSQPIIIESYPGELAIFEGLVSGSTQNVEQSIYLLGDYIQLRNIEIRNTMGYAGLLVESTASDNLIEHVNSNNNIGSGIQNYGDRNRFLSCTASDNSDAGYTDGTFDDGGNSDGFSISRGHLVRIENCVALRNSDDGIDAWGGLDAYIGFCISGENGLATGNGNGIKAGGFTPSGPTLVEHCLSYSNLANGIDYNATRGVTFRKNTTWNNGSDGFEMGLDVNVVDNNALSDVAGPTGGVTTGTLSNNSWQRGGTLAFISTTPGSSDFLRPTVGGGFEDIGAYSPVITSTTVTGQYMTLTVNRSITPAASSVVVAGGTITLTYDTGISNYDLSPIAASVNITSKRLLLEYSGVNLSKINGVVI